MSKANTKQAIAFVKQFFGVDATVFKDRDNKIWLTVPFKRGLLKTIGETGIENFRDQGVFLKTDNDSVRTSYDFRFAGHRVLVQRFGGVDTIDIELFDQNVPIFKNGPMLFDCI